MWYLLESDLYLTPDFHHSSNASHYVWRTLLNLKKTDYNTHNSYGGYVNVHRNFKTCCKDFK